MFKGKTILIFVGVFLASANSSAAQEAAGRKTNGTEVVDKTLFAPPQQFPYPTDGVVIGQGWDSFTERGTQAQCVAVTEVAIESNSFDTSVEEIKSTFSLVKDQSMSASLGGSFGGFGGSGSVSSTTSHKLETDFSNVLFSFNASIGSTRAIGIGGAGDPFGFSALDSRGVEVLEKSEPAAQSYAYQILAQEPRPRRGSEVELTPAALALLTAGDTPKFQRVCGDGFVSAIHRGTRVHVLATFQSRSEKDKSSFAASLEAKGFGVSASGSMSSALEQTVFDSKTRYSISQQGGIPFAPPTKIDDLSSMFLKTENFIERPAAFAITITPYSNVVNYPLETGLESPTRLKRLGDYYVVLSDLYKLTSEILQYASNPALASPYDPKVIEAYGGVKHLREVKDAIHRDLKLLETGITACYRNRSGCDEVTVKNTSIKTAEAAAATLQSSATKLAAQTSSSKESLSSGKNADAAKTLGAITGEPVPIPSIEKTIALMEKNLVQLNGLIAQLHGITGVLSGPDPEISDAFFQRFYSYLIEIPLAKEQFASDLKTGVDDAAIKNLTGELRTAILINRLMPWKQYFCKESMSEYLCVYDEQLVSLVNSASLGFADQAVTIRIPQNVCHYFLNGGEIAKQQFDAVMNDNRPFANLFRRQLSYSCVLVYVPK
jgi:hypothetical protein